jgi:hypothetical protein
MLSQQNEKSDVEGLYMFFAIFTSLLFAIYVGICVVVIPKVYKEMNFTAYFSTLSIIITLGVRAMAAIF